MVRQKYLFEEFLLPLFALATGEVLNVVERQIGGTLNTLVDHTVNKILADFQASLKTAPPVSNGVPDPYERPKK